MDDLGMDFVESQGLPGLGGPTGPMGPMGQDMMGPEYGMGYGMGEPGYGVDMTGGMPYGTQNGPMAYGQMTGMLDQYDMYGQPGVPFEADREKLKRLGFVDNDINLLENVVSQNRGRMPGQSKLCQMGLGYNQAVMLRYMYNISIGKIPFNTREDMAKHLRKMWQGQRVGLYSLPASTVSELNRFCMIAHLPAPWDCLNSAQHTKYGGLKQGMYKVDKIAGGWTRFTTTRRPVLTPSDPTEVDGIIRVESVNRKEGTVSYAANNHYVKMCNRFVIVATLRRPYDHLGMSSILCMDGTTVYVVALPVKAREGRNYYNQSQRVYAYGVDGKDILPALQNISVAMFNYFQAFMMEQEFGSIEYQQLLDPTAIEAERQEKADETMVGFDDLED